MKANSKFRSRRKDKWADKDLILADLKRLLTELKTDFPSRVVSITLGRGDSDDAEWFKRHPHRTHRIRPLISSDLPEFELAADADAIIVQQIRPGMRRRTPIHGSPLPSDNDDELQLILFLADMRDRTDDRKF